MKIGIVSDTHDNIEKAKKAADFFERKEIEEVVHCGDIIAPFTAEIFDRDFNFYYVRGNNDGEWNLKQTIEEFGHFHNNIAELEFDGETFAVYHGTEEEIVEALVRSDNYDYVLRGHTHRRKRRDYDASAEINPGGIKLPEQKEKFSVAVLETRTGEVRFFMEDEMREK